MFDNKTVYVKGDVLLRFNVFFVLFYVALLSLLMCDYSE